MVLAFTNKQLKQRNSHSLPLKQGALDTQQHKINFKDSYFDELYHHLMGELF